MSICVLSSIKFVCFELRLQVRFGFACIFCIYCYNRVFCHCRCRFMSIPINRVHIHCSLILKVTNACKCCNCMLQLRMLCFFEKQMFFVEQWNLKLFIFLQYEFSVFFFWTVSSVIHRISFHIHLCNLNSNVSFCEDSNISFFNVN